MHTQPLRVPSASLSAPSAPAPSFSLVLLLAGGGLAAVMLLLVGAALAEAPAPAAPEPIVQAAPAPTCDALEAELPTLSQLFSEGRLGAAADLARHHLTTPDLCPEAQRALATIAYSAQVQGLLAQPVQDGGVDARERWVAIESWADAQHLPASQRLSPAAVFSQAYGLGAWALAHEAFGRLWGAQTIGPSDTQQLIAYVALLRNWGNAVRHAKGDDAPARAEQLLATSQAIADTLELPMGEACADLEAWGVDHCRRIQPDYADPVLAALLSPHE